MKKKPARVIRTRAIKWEDMNEAEKAQCVRAFRCMNLVSKKKK